MCWMANRSEDSTCMTCIMYLCQHIFFPLFRAIARVVGKKCVWWNQIITMIELLYYFIGKVLHFLNHCTCMILFFTYYIPPSTTKMERRLAKEKEKKQSTEDISLSEKWFVGQTSKEMYMHAVSTYMPFRPICRHGRPTGRKFRPIWHHSTYMASWKSTSMA